MQEKVIMAPNIFIIAVRYIVEKIVRNSEDLSLSVVYRGLYTCEQFGPNPVWHRPLAMFIEEVDINGIKQPRFKRVE
jgi:hypothetical protein